MKRIQKELHKIAAAVLAALLLCGAFAGCTNVRDIVSSATSGGTFPVEINGVTVGSRPQRVVVLSPSLADVVLALGYETQLAAGSEDCVQDSLRDLKKIPVNSIQSVTEESPDLVLAGPELDGGILTALREANLTVLVLEPAVDREDFERLYSQLGSALAGSDVGYDKGIDKAQDIFLVLDTINRIVPKDKVTTACYLYDTEGHAVTGDTLGSTIMGYAGVTNVFNSESGGTYDFESLRVANPDLIFCPPGLTEQIRADERFQNFQAVKNGRLVELDPAMMAWQGRTVVQTAYEICGAAFPELLEESSMEVSDPTEKIESEVSSAMESASGAAEEKDETVYEPLEEGDQSEAVLKMQQRLTELGYLDVEFDGHYGAYTASCVKEFQEANGLEATGAADANTLKAMFSKNAKAKKAAQ